MNGPVLLKDIAEVCNTCYESIDSVRGECAHTKECYVVGERGEVLEKVRPKPTKEMILSVYSYSGHVFNGNYKLCRNYPPCKSKCTFAHGSLELRVWNGTLKVERRCPICRASLRNLFEKGCLDSVRCKGCKSLLLYRNSNGERYEVHRQLPRNKQKMKSKAMKFRFKHAKDKCLYGKECNFPHSKLEEEVWNLLLYSPKVSPGSSELPNKANETSQVKQTVPQVTYQDGGHSYSVVPVQSISKQHLEARLSPECYKDHFLALLHLEENRRQALLEEKCNGDYTLTVTHSLDEENRWIFTGFLQPHHSELHLEIIEYASEFSDKVQLRLPSEDVIMGTNINLFQAEDKHMLAIDLLAVDALGPLRYNSEMNTIWTVTASFLAKQSYEICRKRLRALEHSVVRKLFPNTATVERPRREVHVSQGSPLVPSLDTECQMPALRAILGCPPSAPFLLTGPFGTGKTRLIVRATYEVLLTSPRARVLISVHHNQTASTYIDDYFGKMTLSRGNLLCHVARAVSTAKRIPNSRFSHLYFTYNDPYVRSRDCRVVVTTCTVAGMLARELPSGWFTHIFVDEAAQPVEPEAVMPLALADPETRIVLAGDHLQCGPQDTVHDHEAGKNGLYISLLERLHSLYMSQGKGSVLREDYTASLFTNYRCDAAILRLPSILLYECSLLTRATDCSPHPEAHYPVMFVCSSMDKCQTNMSTSDIDEASLVVEVASRYLNQWPGCWSTFHADQVSILARTHQQQNVLRREMKQAPRQGCLRGSQVRVTYAIQGLEFRVVFLSTHEPREYEDGGKLLPCLDQGGTVVNERVFNTMITRAKSLFVAIGNPFYLLDAEESLVETGSQTSQTALCWREFLKTCIDHNSIIYPKNCASDQRIELLERVYDEPSVGSKPSTKKDSILMKTKEDMREKVVQWLKNNGVHLYRGEWILGQTEASLRHSSDGKRCGSKGMATHILICTKVGEAKAEPLQHSGQEYRIIGLNNRRGALDEALVKVKRIPIKTHFTSAENEPKPRAPLGKVEQVVQQGPTDTFLCRVDPFNNNLMIPLNAKDPKLYNLPHISCVLMNTERGKVPKTGKHELGPVVCFDKDSLTRDNPRIRDVIPFKDAKNMLFLVMFIRWGAKFYFPLGAVIDVFPVGHSFFHAQRILKAKHHIIQRCDGKLGPVPPNDSVQPTADFPFAFTLDQPGSVTLDDALSLKRIDTDVDADADSKTYEFAVHITSVASNERVTDLLKLAQEKGCTVYQPYKGKTKRYSMLPEQEAQSMSLDVGCVRECISIVGQVKIACDGLTVTSVGGEFIPQTTKVRSEAKLFYDQVEKVLDGRAIDSEAITEYAESCDSDEYPPLTEQLALLHLISQYLKDLRLESSIFSASQCLPDRQDQHSKYFPQASGLVQEFMIWAGWKVAEFLSNDPISYVPLRRQEAPSEERLRDITPQIQQALRPYHEQQVTLPENGITFSMSIVKQLLGCMERGDQNGYSDVKRIYLAQQSHPQLTVAMKKWYGIQRRAEYCIREDAQPIDQYKHFSLNCLYTHFSSPLRRCFDILVQMSILNKLGEMNSTQLQSASEARNLAQICNGKMRKAVYFQREAQQVEIAVKCFQSSLACSCYVEGQQGHFLTVAFSDPSLKDIDPRCCCIPLDALKYSPQAMEEEPDNSVTLVHATWKYKVCCLNSAPTVVKDYLLPAGYSPRLSLTDNVSVVHTYTVETHVIDGEAEECFKRNSSLVAQSQPLLYLKKSQWLCVRDIVTKPSDTNKLQTCAKMLQKVEKLAQAQSEKARAELYANIIQASVPFNTGKASSSTDVEDPRNVERPPLDKKSVNEHDKAVLESASDESACNETGSDESASNESGSDESSSDVDSETVSDRYRLPKIVSGPVACTSTDVEDPCDVGKLLMEKARWHNVKAFCETDLGSSSDSEQVPSSSSNQAAPQSVSGPVAFQVFEVARSISPADPLDVWVGVSVRDRIISPAIHLVQPVPGLDLCVQHSQWPEECFSDPVLKNASRGQYPDINKYVNFWEPVLLAEAAMAANKEHDLLFLNEVALQFHADAFKQPCDALEEPHFVYQKDAEITLLLQADFVEHSAFFFPFVVGNFVCVRYEVQRNTASDETSIAASDETSIPASDETSIAASDETSIAASDKTSIAASNETSIAANDETSIPASDETSIAASDGTSIAASDGTTIAASDKTSIAASDETSCAGSNETSCAASHESSCASTSTLRAIFHMVIIAVEDIEDDSACPPQATLSAELQQSKAAVLTAPKDTVGPKPKKVTFKFVGERNSMLSSELKRELEGGEQMCTMQLISSPIPMRRMYRVLISLHDHFTEPKNKLSTNIACGDIIAANSENLKFDPSEILGSKKRTDKFRVEGGKPAAYCLWPWPKNFLLDTLKQLNEHQWLAAWNAMRHKFTLIQGPPGTGKSVTGAHLALAFALYNIQYPPSTVKLLRENNRTIKAMRPIMYCAPSNKAVDRVLDILHVLLSSELCLKSLKLKAPLRILRLYSKAVERKSYPGPFADKKVFPQEDSDHECPAEFQCYALHHIIQHDASSPLEKLEKKFQKMHLKGLTPAPKAVSNYRKVMYQAELHTLMNNRFDIVLCTCNEAASHRVMETIRPAQCIIDEAGMATEPETMIPINLSDHVVLIGDHKQLQPVIMCRGARDNGLSVSLFQRYYTEVQGVQYFTRLTEQYRMHRLICEFPSKCFYEKSLDTHRSVKAKYAKFMKKNSTLNHRFWVQRDCPIMFCHVTGKEDSWKEKDEKVALQSKLNEKEARHVMFIVKHLLIDLGVKGRIAVLTFYKGQKRKLEKLWRALEMSFPHLKRLYRGSDEKQSFQIRTVNESQGDEFDIVLLSTVRSLPDGDYDESVAGRRWLMENVGFVTNPHQICVGITRAKFGLIIVGNSNLLRMDEITWKSLIEHYEKKGCLKDYSRWPVNPCPYAV